MNTRNINGRMLKVVFLFLLNAVSFSMFAVTRYVTAAGDGLRNGTSWANAFAGISLQSVINSSGGGDQVWVACGTYFTTMGTNRTISFTMRNGVSIYGSFSGTETAISQRVFNCGPCSILSAEIGVAGNADNSYHVINNGSLNASALIDGFVITGANDNRVNTLNEGLGGGIYNQGLGTSNVSSPTIQNCVITNNSAGFGGGIFNNGFNGGNANPTITNCIIANNTAYDGGGGIDNFGLGGNASPVVTNTLIYGNTALTAGGVYCWGGNANGNSSPVFLNCVIANNAATAGNAGGIICDNSNSADAGSSGTSNPTLRNSIIRGNTASLAGPQFCSKGTGTFIATYSAVDVANQNAPHVITGPGTGNIFSDPLFVDPLNPRGPDNCWMTSDDGLMLQNGSPGVNAGNNTGITATDLRFFPRLQGNNVDIGAYENVAGILPMRFLQFSGREDQGIHKLTWKVADEEPGNYYQVERSSDGVNFETIGPLFSTNTSHATHEYTHDDHRPLEGINYYRIKCGSANNNDEQWSIVITLVSKNDLSIIVANNMAARSLAVESRDPVLLMEVMNTFGTLIIRENNRYISYAHHLPGVYYLRVTTTKKQKVFKVIFQ